MSVEKLEQEEASCNNLKRDQMSVAIESTIPCFEGDTGISVKIWFKNFENNALVYKWNEQQKYVYARNKMTKSAELFLQTVLISDYKTLKSKLESEFDRSYSSAEIHSRLQQRKKLDSESFYEYILQMRNIGFLGDVDDRSIIKYIVDGIKGKNENKIGLYSAKNYADLRQQFEIYEQIFKHKDTPQRSDNNNNIKKQMHCYNCGSKEHKRNECRNKQKCFKCNKEGHIAKFCAERQIVNCTLANKMRKNVIIEGKNFQCLIDGGASISIMKDEIFNENFDKKCLQKSYIQIEGLGGAVVPTNGIFQCKVQLDGFEVVHNIAIVPKSAINCDVIVGFDILSKFRYTSDERRYNFHSIINEAEKEVQQLMTIDTSVLEQSDIPHELRERVRNIEMNYEQKSKVESPITMKITLIQDDPIYTVPSRLPLAEQRIVEEQVKEWLAQGIVRKSSSPYCSRIVLANKKDGTKRVCVDYRRINKIVLRDRFPVPNMEDVIDHLAGSRIYSVLDIKNAFFHVPVEENSKKYLAFVTKNGVFEFNYAPFGFCNSPSNFIRFVNTVFQDLINNNYLQMYVDDIIIYSEDYHTGLEKLESVVKVAAENGLAINWKKCKFLTQQVEFLGLVIENGTIKPSEEKMRAVDRFEEPKNIKTLQSFLGLVGFFRKFVKNFSIIARPLTDLLKKGTNFVMEAPQKAAIRALKDYLTTQPILKIFSSEANTELHTDASKEGYGAILFQEYESNWYPVYYYSKKISEADCKLHSYVLETNAAFLGMQKLRHYLLGLKFTLVTDCSALKHTIAKQDLSPAVTRYIMYMQDFEFTIKHRRGDQMKHVDALSRHTVMMLNPEAEIKCRLAKAQEADDGIRAIKDMLKHGPYKNYKLIANVLFKVTEGNEVLVVPRHMEKEVITTAHQNGHFGLDKTMHQIKQHYYIPHLEGKIRKILNNCVHCILYSRKSGKQEGFLHNVDKGDQPLHTLHVDHLGPLDATTKLYKHIFVIVDGFSKFTWLYPTRSTGVDEVINKLECWRASFGNPRRIISDKGPAFTSNNFEEFCKKSGIEHITITTGVPRGNGQVERVNRTILPVIAKLSAENPQKWYKYISKVQTAINSNVHRATKYTPFEVLFGTKMNTEARGVDVVNMLKNELIEEYDKERNQIREEAKQQIAKIQEENVRTYNKRRKQETKYEVGELVAIKRTQIIAGKKLASEYLGPYEVVKVKRMGRYDVLKKGNVEGPIKTSTSVDNMKPWRNEREEDVSSETDD